MLPENHSNKRILVIGDLMLDHYVWGVCERISPEAPVPVVDVTREELTLGGAGNVIQNLCSFGLIPDVISVTGRDESAIVVRQLLEADGVATDWIFEETGRQTSRKTRVIAANHHMVRIDKETKTPISAESEQQIIALVEKEAAKYHLVMLSDYLKGVLTERLLAAVIKTCRAYQVPVIVDPKGADFSKYRGVNYIKPNKKEAGIAAATAINDNASLLAAAAKIYEIVACDALIITLSEEGMAVYNGVMNRIPTRAREVFDVTGAGDTVLAGIGVCLADGLSLHDACVFANHAAAIVVAKVGSATCTIDEVNAHMAAQ